MSIIKTNLESLGGLVGSSDINSDSDGSGLNLGNTSGLKLLEGESTSKTGLGVVSLVRATNDGSNKI